jgi:hypothetical protein
MSDRSVDPDRPVGFTGIGPGSRRVRGRRILEARLLRQHGLGLLMALATAVAMTWSLARPALWLDEGATVVATQRTLPDLWTLRQGPEAPMLPYYLLMKVFSGVAGRIAPALESHPEVLFRLLSVMVSVLAGWALITWLSRFCPAKLVVITGVMLLLMGGYSRYGQEARAYAAVLFFAVVCTIVWSVLITDPRRRWVAAYAVTVAAMVALHTLSVGLVVAHLAAAVVTLGPGLRLAAALRTTTSAALGLLLVAPLVLITAQNGTGPTAVLPNMTAEYAFSRFVQLFTTSDHPILGMGSVLLLAVVGLLRVNSEQYRFVARLAACWALIPVAVLLVVVWVHPNLLMGRYVLFVIPAWAILAGLGVVTLADLTRAAFARQPYSASVLATAVSSVVALALIAGTAVDQTSTQREIRTRSGHAEDIRPALALAIRPEYAQLPIMTSSRGAVLIGVYGRRSDEERLIAQRFQRKTSAIWPQARSTAESARSLRRKNRAILLQRASPRPLGCLQLESSNATQIEHCMPSLLRRLGYRVERVEPAGVGWAFAIIEKKASK